MIIFVRLLDKIIFHPLPYSFNSSVFFMHYISHVSLYDLNHKNYCEINKRLQICQRTFIFEKLFICYL